MYFINAICFDVDMLTSTFVFYMQLYMYMYIYSIYSFHNALHQWVKGFTSDQRK